MKMLKNISIFIALAGIAFLIIGAAAMINPALLSLSGAHVVATGIAVLMVGFIGFMAAYSSEVSFLPDEK